MSSGKVGIDMTEILFLILFLIVIVIIILMAIFMNIQNKRFKEMIADKEKDDKIKAVEQNNNLQKKLNDFSRQINDDLIKFNNIISENTTNHLNKIQVGLNASLIKNFETTEKLINSMSERMVRIDEAQKNLKDLSGELISLQNILKDKKSRGIFGEVELYSILEGAFGLNDNLWQKQCKLTNGSIADAVIFAPEPLGKIVIDSKFPLENYNRIYDQDSDKAARDSARRLFRNDVMKHINDISCKYLIDGDTAPMAYMFIPAEAVFAEIYGHFDDVVQYSYDKHVYLVSPTTLMAYITAIKGIYLGQKRDEKVALIQEEFSKLAIEFDRYKERYDRLYRDFDRVYQDFTRLNTTSEKIVRRFSEIHSVKLEDPKGIEHDD